MRLQNLIYGYALRVDVFIQNKAPISFKKD